MNNKINLKQNNSCIYIDKVLDNINYQRDDIVFFSGSLIEGMVNKLSSGMGNKLSDIDVFIMSNDIDNIEHDKVDYNKKYLKTKFQKIDDANLDIEIYSLSLISDLISQLNTASLQNDRRILNEINCPDGFELYKFISFIHRFYNSIVIYGNESFDKIKASINRKKYLKLATRYYVNLVEANYEDVIGNLESGQFEVALVSARRILLDSMKAYIFFKGTSIDKDKWVPLKLRNLSVEDKEAERVYKEFKNLYFEEHLTDNDRIVQNTTEIVDFINDLMLDIGEEGGI